MIPNTDINCGKCATPIYSDCVMWSGQNLSCVTVLQDCCDTTLTKVVELLGDYVCNISNVAHYNIPVCMQSFDINDFAGMQNAMMELICQQQTNINLSGLTWGCTTSGTTSSVNDVFQALINQVNTQSITYSTSYFSVNNIGGCPSKSLAIKQGTWISVSGTSFYNSFSFVNTGIYYMIDPATNTVRLKGTIYRSVITSMVGMVYSAGSSVIIGDLLASSIIPSFTLSFNVPGFNNTYAYGQGSMPTQYYNLSWNITVSSNGSGGLRISAYIPYGATLNGGSESVKNDGNVTFLLDSIQYTLN